MQKYTVENSITEIPQWISKFENLIKRMTWVDEERKAFWTSNLDQCRKPPEFIVALLGGTGAGKSSLVNAVLEANIVPTSGNKACTSVITEITYHPSPCEADIHFISKESWKGELQRFLGDIKDDLGDSLDRNNQDHIRLQLRSPEAKQAWRTMKTIYPKLELKDLVGNDDTSFLFDKVRWPHLNYLSTIEHISPHHITNFANQIKGFLNENGPWPLICNVKIRCPSRVLATGVTLVDLPGVSDSNAARSAISTAYIKRCHHLWIVSPITRAADAQITSDIIGMSKTQLQNGLYTSSKITFIVTKCDDLDPQEVINNLSLQDDPAFLEIAGQKHAYDRAFKDAYLEVEWCRKLVQEAEDDKLSMQVDSMNGVTNLKRKAPDSPESIPAKRIRTDNADIRDHKLFNQTVAMGEGELYRNLNGARDKLDTCRKNQSEATSALRLFCALKRSKNTRDALSERFLEEDENDGCDGTTPDIFTVSTWDFLKLKGILNDQTKCFLDTADTGIPNLQTHCQSLSYSDRERFARTSLSRFKVLAVSICSYLKDIEGQDENGRLDLAKRWGSGKPTALRSRLMKEFTTKRKDVIRTLEKSFSKGLQTTCINAAEEAVNKAHPTAVKLQEDMRWQRLRATYRRQGVWCINMNEEFLAPFTGIVLDAWRETLDTDYFPDLCERLAEIIRVILSDLIKSCHGGIQSRAEIQAQETLEENTIFLEELQHAVKAELDNQRKETTGFLSPEIQRRLSEGYDGALLFSGKGSVKKQREYFNDYVNKIKRELFDGLKAILLNGLKSIAEAVSTTLEQNLFTLAHKVHVGMSNLWEKRQGRTPEHDLIEIALQQYLAEVRRCEKITRTWTRVRRQVL